MPDNDAAARPPCRRYQVAGRLATMVSSKRCDLSAYRHQMFVQKTNPAERLQNMRERKTGMVIVFTTNHMLKRFKFVET
ncbi:hypothetical protein JQV76_08805 [Sulfitobacter geojensis]|nr:hypothetical protein [Sulfitobacter geojensis]